MLGGALLLVVVIVVPGMTCVYPASNRGATAGAVLLILMIGLILALVLHRVEVGPGVSSVVDPPLGTAVADLLSLLLIGVGRVRAILSRIRHLPGMGVWGTTIMIKQTVTTIFTEHVITWLSGGFDVET